MIIMMVATTTTTHRHTHLLKMMIEGYELVQSKPLGEGSYGVVFEGRDKRSGKRVAIKRTIEIFNKVLLNPDDAIKTLREIRVLKKMNESTGPHHHCKLLNVISPVIDNNPTVFNHRPLNEMRREWFPELGDFYLVFELMETNLENFLIRNMLTVETAVKIMHQILLGLKLIHSASAAHRDLKPANILVNTSPLHIAIADFGFARAMQHDDIIMTGHGTSFGAAQSAISPRVTGFAAGTTQAEHPLNGSNGKQTNPHRTWVDANGGEEQGDDNTSSKRPRQQSPNLGQSPSEFTNPSDLHGGDVLTARSPPDGAHNGDVNAVLFSSSSVETTGGAPSSPWELGPCLWGPSDPPVVGPSDAPVVVEMERQYSSKVQTIYYRAPELTPDVSTHQHYTSAVDVWSAACVFAEVWSRVEGNTAPGPRNPSPLFVVEKDNMAELLAEIFNLIGQPPFYELTHVLGQDAVTELRNARVIDGGDPEPIDVVANLMALYDLSHADWGKGKSKAKKVTSEVVDLLSKMLVFDPARRLSVEQALEHPLFHSLAPPATSTDPLLGKERGKLGPESEGSGGAGGGRAMGGAGGGTGVGVEGEGEEGEATPLRVDEEAALEAPERLFESIVAEVMWFKERDGRTNDM